MADHQFELIALSENSVFVCSISFFIYDKTVTFLSLEVLHFHYLPMMKINEFVLLDSILE